MFPICCLKGRGPSACLSPGSLPEPSLPALLFSIFDISLFAAHPICLSPPVLGEQLGSEKRLQSVKVQKQAPSLSSGNPLEG